MSLLERKPIVNGHDKIGINGHEKQATYIWENREKQSRFVLQGPGYISKSAGLIMHR